MIRSVSVLSWNVRGLGRKFSLVVLTLVQKKKLAIELIQIIILPFGNVVLQ